jgi:hypothetical protein
MCVQKTKTANRFEISSLLEKILLKQVRWCLTFVGLYIWRRRNEISIKVKSRVNTTGATIGAGIAYHHITPKFTPGFQ